MKYSFQLKTSLKRFIMVKKIPANIITLLITIIIMVSIYMSVASLRVAQRWITHTNFVIHNGDQLLENTINMESGLRGFLISGDNRSLETYAKGLHYFKKTIHNITEAVSDNPTQVKRLRDIENLLMKWIREVAEPQINKRRSVNARDGKMDDVVNVFKAMKNDYMDQLRYNVDHLLEVESKLLNYREEEYYDILVRLNKIIIFGALFVIIAFVFGLIISRTGKPESNTKNLDSDSNDRIYLNQNNLKFIESISKRKNKNNSDIVNELINLNIKMKKI